MRKVKDVVNDYTEIERKVRKATSNKPYRASGSQMAEIADATYDPVQFPQIMGMLWKRLNEPGKYWRHVYKGLILLDYIVKVGSEKVVKSSRENIFAIQTLKDFQMIDKDGRDQGLNVREKSKVLVTLLKDETKLKEEREKAKSARERMRGSIGGGEMYYDDGMGAPQSSGYPSRTSSGREQPTHRGPSKEEDRQLQLVIEESKREAEQAEKRRQNMEENDPDIQAAIALSKVDAIASSDPFGQNTPQPVNNDPFGIGSDPFGDLPPSNNSQNQYQQQQPQSNQLPLDLFGDPAPVQQYPYQQQQQQPFQQQSFQQQSRQNDPFGDSFGGSDPFGPPQQQMHPQQSMRNTYDQQQYQQQPAPMGGGWPQQQPQQVQKQPQYQENDANAQQAQIARNSPLIDEFSGIRSGQSQATGATAQQHPAPISDNPWDMKPLETSLPMSLPVSTSPSSNATALVPSTNESKSIPQPKKTNTLDAYKDLVNLDALAPAAPKAYNNGPSPSNPFGLSGGGAQTQTHNSSRGPTTTLNQMAGQGGYGAVPATGGYNNMGGMGGYGQPTMGGGMGQPGMGGGMGQPGMVGGMGQSGMGGGMGQPGMSGGMGQPGMGGGMGQPGMGGGMGQPGMGGYGGMPQQGGYGQPMMGHQSPQGYGGYGQQQQQSPNPNGTLTIMPNQNHAPYGGQQQPGNPFG
eukprot:CFRG5664T1